MEHGTRPRPPDLAGGSASGGRELGYTTQPYVRDHRRRAGRHRPRRAAAPASACPTIIIEKNERPGDTWRNRYKSLCLHDPVWYDHLPYIKFPENWPVFAPKDKIGDWLEMYTRVMELNYWSSHRVRKRRRTTTAPGMGRRRRPRRRRGDAAAEAAGAGDRHVGQARTCPSSRAWRVSGATSTTPPSTPGRDAYTGKKAVVIGSNNSAHDICAALWEHGADVTMVQRSSTHIVRSRFADGDRPSAGCTRSEAVAGGMTTEKADLTSPRCPTGSCTTFQIPVYDQMRERDADFYAGLEKAGFELDWGEDGSGLFMKYLRRGSGYYIDVGACQLRHRRRDQARSPARSNELTENAVVLDDGTELPADVIVYATGYGSMNGWAADLISPGGGRQGRQGAGASARTRRRTPVRGRASSATCGSRPSRRRCGSTAATCTSRGTTPLYLALQLKARMEGLETPVYELQPSHHTR